MNPVRLTFSRLFLAICALGLLPACPKYVDVNLKLLEPCDQVSRALNGIRTYRIEVVEDDGEVNGASFSPGTSTPVQIGLGTTTEIDVLAWTEEAADSQSKPKSIGHTVLPGLPDDVGTEPIEVSVIMGLGDSMGKVSSMSEGGGSQCEELTSGVTVDGRHAHTATYIPNINKVLIIGGAIWIEDNQSGGRKESFLRSAELWDPATGVFTQLPELPQTRAYHTATALPDGDVFVAGGFSFINGEKAALSGGFHFEPSRMTDDATEDACSTQEKEGCPFVAVGLKARRAMHTANLLGNDIVVLVGGCYGKGCASDGVSDDGTGAGDPTELQSAGTVEVYNIADKESAIAEGLINPRAMHASSVINSGGPSILISGGVSSQGPVCTMELLRLSAGTVDNLDSLSDAQRNLTVCPIRHQQVSLSDSRVALIGGQTAAAGGRPEGLGVKTVQFWNSGIGIEAATATLFEGRVGHTAHLLDNGSILVYGGTLSTLGGAPAERLELTSGNSFVPTLLTFPPEAAFDRSAAAQLPNNQIFVSGGHTDLKGGTLLSSKAAYLYFGE
ncbi:MAG: hypothetical protein GY822_04550 [Deltaproteobacteria bacterium]|nr:hypothetical protein [Deltaproteobacteria bacterium]